MSVIRAANLTGSISRNAGGLFESVRHLVQALIETGMDVRVFGVRDEFSKADLEAWHPVPVGAFRSTWPKRFGYSTRFLKEVQAFQPDLVHTHGLWLYPSIVACRYTRGNRHPYIISAHGMLDPWAIRNSRWKKAIAYWIFEGKHLRGARCLRALCEAEARAIRRLGLKNDIAIIPNGIDLPSGSPPARPPWDGFIEPGRKVLLFLSRIHPKKGIPNLIKAWAAVRKSAATGPSPNDWVLAIAGWDQAAHELELMQLATELGLAWTDVRRQPEQLRGRPASSPASPAPGGPWSVLFLGPQFNQAKAACYHHCDAFVLPSLSEGVPMVVLEAWAYSKPVLMTAQCNLPLGFSAGAAIEVEPTAEGMARGLNDLCGMTDAGLSAMGSRARDLVAQQFVWNRIAGQMKSVYDWTLGGGCKPDCFWDS